MTQLIQTPIQVGSLTVLDGCMFAGKSGTLIHEANTLRRQNINVVIVAPAMSRRRESEKERLESHDGVVALCETSYLEVDQLYQVCLSLNAQVICIDFQPMREGPKVVLMSNARFSGPYAVSKLVSDDKPKGVATCQPPSVAGNAASPDCDTGET